MPTLTPLKTHFKFGVLLLVLLLLTACELDLVDSGNDPALLPDGDLAQVVQIIDGDTIDVRLLKDGGIYRVRYIGINTPERADVCFAESTAANEQLVDGQTVLLVKDVSEVDRFDRLLRYVYVGDTFVNAQLVADGWAEAVRYPPDTAHNDFFDGLQAGAQNLSLGCWPTGVFD